MRQCERPFVVRLEIAQPALFGGRLVRDDLARLRGELVQREAGHHALGHGGDAGLQLENPLEPP